MISTMPMIRMVVSLSLSVLGLGRRDESPLASIAIAVPVRALADSTVACSRIGLPRLDPRRLVPDAATSPSHARACRIPRLTPSDPLLDGGLSARENDSDSALDSRSQP